MNPAYHIAVVLYKYFPYGGLQRDCYKIAASLIKQGHQVDIFCMSWEGEHLPGSRLFLLDKKKGSSEIRNNQFHQQFKTHINREQYDCIIGFNKMPHLDIYYAADGCYQEKAKTKRGFLYQLLPRYRHFLANEEAVFKNSKTLILQLSKASYHSYLAYYPDSATHSVVLPPNLDISKRVDQFCLKSQQKNKAKYKISPDEKLILMVGSGFKTKGVDRTLKALAALNENLRSRTKLWIAGSDNPKKFIQQAKQLNLSSQVRFLGGRDDISQLMQTADVLAHPAYNENAGIVILESIASALPIIVSDVCGYAVHIKQSQSGIVIQSDSKFQIHFNQALYQLLTSDTTPMREKAIQYAHQTDLYSMQKTVVDIILNTAQDHHERNN